MGWQVQRSSLSWFCILFFSSLSTAIPTMAAAYALDKSIQAYWAHTTIDASLIWKMLWIIVGSIALNFLFSYLRAILQESIGYEVAAGQRIHLGDVLKRVPLGYFSQNSVGDILAGVTTELSTLELQGMKWWMSSSMDTQSLLPSFYA